jgi:hypothetical protein
MFLNFYRRRLRSEALMRIVFEERRFGDESGDAVPMTAGSSRRTLHVDDESGCVDGRQAQTDSRCDSPCGATRKEAIIAGLVRAHLAMSR